jgi:hypothetical protein
LVPVFEQLTAQIFNANHNSFRYFKNLVNKYQAKKLKGLRIMVQYLGETKGSTVYEKVISLINGIHSATNGKAWKTFGI